MSVDADLRAFQVVARLREVCEASGGQRAWARKANMPESLRKKQDPTPRGVTIPARNTNYWCRH